MISVVPSLRNKLVAPVWEGVVEKSKPFQSCLIQHTEIVRRYKSGYPA